MADLTDAEIRAFRAIAAEHAPKASDGPRPHSEAVEARSTIELLPLACLRLLDEVERRRRERDMIDAFIAGLCLRTGLEYTREWGLLEEILANPDAGRRA